MPTPTIRDLREPQPHQQATAPSFSYKGPDEFKNALTIAQHYGFRITQPVKKSSRVKKTLKDLKVEKPQKTGEWYIPFPHTLAEADEYIRNMHGHPHPVMLAYTQHPRRKVGKVRLAVLGSTRSVAEAMVIRATVSILKSLGHNDVCLNINSLGDEKSQQKFSEQFAHHVRDHLNDLGDCCQTVFKNDALSITRCDNDPCKHIHSCAPEPISFLDDYSQNHLKRVLEYIEALEIPYRINRRLVGTRHHRPELLFQFRIKAQDKNGDEKERIVARGERSLRLPHYLGHAHSLSVVSCSIDTPGGRHESYRQEEKNKDSVPKFYFAHLSTEARRKALHVLEILRERHIRVRQAMTADGLAQQIKEAKELKVPYTLIMGLKEAQEDNIIVRNMFTRAQQTISVSNLIDHLERL